MKWNKIRLKTKVEAVESVIYTLTELGIQGVQIEDNQPLTEREKQQMYVDILEENKDATDDTAYLTFYISVLEDIDLKVEKILAEVNALRDFVDVGTLDIDIAIVDEEDWVNNWKKYFKPFRVDGNIVIKPTWEKLKDEKPEDIVIEIDPGMAFGSGTHETTSLCIQSLNKYLFKDATLIDVGCGSGILGIAGAKLGAKWVKCIDIDKNAVVVAKENVEINKETKKIEVFEGNLLNKIKEKADIVVANILAEVIIILTDDIKEAVEPNGLFISSGIIKEKAESVISKLEAKNFLVLEVLTKGEWVAIIAKNME